MNTSTARAHAALIVALIASPLAFPAAAASDPDRLAEMPLGFAALDIEREVGADVSAARVALDRAVSEARSRLPETSPRATLRAVAEAVAVVCPTLIEDAGDGLISSALRRGQCDCDDLVVAYLTVADVLGLPLAAVFLPNHVLVVWDDGRTRVYWETTRREERPPWLVETKVPDGSHAYLRPQSRREMIGYFFHVRANYLMERGAATEALADYDRTAALNPSFMLTYSNRGRAHLLAGRYARALADFDRALRLDPTYGDAVYGRGLTLLALDRHVEALGAFARVTESQGIAADVLHAEGLALAGLGRDDDALRKYDDAIALDPSFALVYEARGVLYEQMGRVEKARSDYLTFIRLAADGPDRDSIPAVRQRLATLPS